MFRYILWVCETVYRYTLWHTIQSTNIDLNYPESSHLFWKVTHSWILVINICLILIGPIVCTSIYIFSIFNSQRESAEMNVTRSIWLCNACWLVEIDGCIYIMYVCLDVYLDMLLVIWLARNGWYNYYVKFEYGLDDL